MLTDEKKKVVELYNQGLELYRGREWKKSMDCFQKALEIDPKDGPSKLYLERCQIFIENPPPDDWDGVFTMTTK